MSFSTEILCVALAYTVPLNVVSNHISPPARSLTLCHQHFLLASLPYIHQSTANTGSYKGCDYHTYYTLSSLLPIGSPSFLEAHRHGS